MNKTNQVLLSIAAAGLLLVVPSVAHASLDACGGVYLSLDAQCEFVQKETCTTRCEDVAMETSCAAKLYGGCEVECTATAEVTCIETCGPSCAPTCETQATTPDAEPPNARGLCMSSCQQDCTDDCADSPNQGECRSSCAHTCGDICEKRCDEEPAVECEPTCTVACAGSCEAQASSSCQVTCQAEQFTVCKTELVQHCEEECETTGGALYCDGQFLNVTELQACADQLHAELAIDVSVEIDVEVECTSSECEVDSGGKAEGDAEGGCFSTIDPRGGLGGTLMALGIVGLHLVRRRRRV
jgi:hypothetical protein